MENREKRTCSSLLIRWLGYAKKNNCVLVLNSVGECPLQSSLSFKAGINHNHNLPTNYQQGFFLFDMARIQSFGGSEIAVRRLGLCRRGADSGMRPNSVEAETGQLCSYFGHLCPEN